MAWSGLLDEDAGGRQKSLGKGADGGVFEVFGSQNFR